MRREIGGEGLIAGRMAVASMLIWWQRTKSRFPFQINGKKRADLTIARDADRTAVQSAVLALEAVQAALNGQNPKRSSSCRRGS